MHNTSKKKQIQKKTHITIQTTLAYLVYDLAMVLFI